MSDSNEVSEKVQKLTQAIGALIIDSDVDPTEALDCLTRVQAALFMAVFPQAPPLEIRHGFAQAVAGDLLGLLVQQEEVRAKQGIYPQDMT